MAIKIEVFSSNSCPHCPGAIKVAQDVQNDMDLDIEVEILNVNDPENMKKARDYQLMAVPTIAINGKVEFVGAPTEDQLVSKINEIVN
ncbi:MAG: MJ0307 family thioredoxin [Methanobrevibacter sp.]|nr:MJ0307 family thioredoxin [Methanobrevibacter sp.]